MNVSDQGFSEAYMYLFFLKLRNLCLRSLNISHSSSASDKVSSLLLLSCSVSPGGPIEAFKVKPWFLLQTLEKDIVLGATHEGGKRIRWISLQKQQQQPTFSQQLKSSVIETTMTCSNFLFLRNSWKPRKLVDDSNSAYIHTDQKEFKSQMQADCVWIDKTLDPICRTVIKRFGFIKQDKIAISISNQA